MQLQPIMQQQPISNELFQSLESDALYERYGHSIFAYIRLHKLSREDAEDITLEVFLVAFEQDNLSGMGEGEQLAWLRRIARNKLVDQYRSKIRHPLIALEQVAQVLFDDEARTPEQQVVQREAYERLHQAIRGLPSLHQQLLRLRYCDGLRFTEIAVLLNKREEALRQLVSRTLTRLRHAFELPQEQRRR